MWFSANNEHVLASPNVLKLTHVDIYMCILVYFLEVPLFVIKYMYAMISGSESEKKLCL